MHTQDSIGEFFYILENGTADVIKDNQKISRLGPGRSFGDVAVINDVTYTVTVRAAVTCHVWVLDRRSFRCGMAAAEKRSRNDKVAFLQTVKLFEKLSERSLGLIADVMQAASYEKGERVIRQGEVRG
jgi:cAMP-dependent protein kinase regulator